MAKVITDNQHYADIAEAIRTKNETETLYKPSEMASAILEIQGGVELNFSIVGGETIPTDPAVNTIWVNTPNEITSWTFRLDEPSNPAPGMVWLVSSENGTNFFNALKKNEIFIGLVNVKQYIDGAWTSVSGEIYSDAEWKPLGKPLYNAGDERTDITGGWTVGNAYSGKWVKSADKIVADYTSTSNVQGWAVTKNTIDVRGYSKIGIEATVTEIFNASTTPPIFGLFQGTTYEGSYTSTNFKAHKTFTTSGIHYCPIENMQVNTLRVLVGSAWKGSIHRIWLE